MAAQAALKISSKTILASAGKIKILSLPYSAEEVSSAAKN